MKENAQLEPEGANVKYHPDHGPLTALYKWRTIFIRQQFCCLTHLCYSNTIFELVQIRINRGGNQSVIIIYLNGTI